jgi:regulator of protease activity HflC (stomatin/prohibitin superfamily)
MEKDKILNDDLKVIFRGIVKVIAGIFVLWLLLNSYFVVGAGERGVLMTFGAVDLNSYGEGIHFKIPIIQSVSMVNIKTLKFVDDTGAASKDLQIVTTSIALNYHIDGASAARIYQEIGQDYEAKVIDPAIKESVKANTAQFTAEELITRREEVANKIKESIATKLTSRGIYVESMSIINFDFSESFNNAIEAKVTAEQLKLKAVNDLERIKVEAEQTVTKATAEAEAIKIRANALTQNEKLISLTVAEKWDGHLPNVMVNGDGGNMLFDISNLAQEQK